MRLLLDLDCVLADFFAGVAAVYDMTKEEIEAEYVPGVYCVRRPLARATFRKNNRGEEPPTDLTMGEAEFWWPISVRPGFWRELPKLPWADELVRLAKELTDDLWIVTSPARCPGCIREKEEWVEAHYGIPHPRVVPTAAKYLLAKPGVLLIDDHEANVDRFREEGGAAVLFPCLHNSAHEVRHDPLSVVVPRVTRYFARKS